MVVVMKTWRWSFCIDVGEVDNADDVNADETDYRDDNSDEQNAYDNGNANDADDDIQILQGHS